VLRTLYSAITIGAVTAATVVILVGSIHIVNGALSGLRCPTSYVSYFTPIEELSKPKCEADPLNEEILARQKEAHR
jgi:hypothetical protein